jgi:hypothetical protein
MARSLLYSLAANISTFCDRVSRNPILAGEGYLLTSGSSREKGPVVCRFSDAGSDKPSTRSGVRRANYLPLFNTLKGGILAL